MGVSLMSSTIEPLSIDETQRLLHEVSELERANKALRQIIQRLEQNDSTFKTIYLCLKDFLRHHANALLALPNLLATVLWLAMLAYFLAWYITRPLNEKGQYPQICANFSLWPYISCIGEKKLAIFQGVCIAMAALVIISFVLLCYLGNSITPGRWMRRTSMTCALVSSSSLIALSFMTVDTAPRKHLAATSLSIFSMGATKFFDWISNILVRRRFKRRIGGTCRVRPLEVSRWLKTCVAAFAMGPAITTCAGIYGCQDALITNDPTSTCNKVVALSAVAEWILSISWVAYLLTISFDLYHISVVVEMWNELENQKNWEEYDRSTPTYRFTGATLQTLVPRYDGGLLERKNQKEFQD